MRAIDEMYTKVFRVFSNSYHRADLTDLEKFNAIHECLYTSEFEEEIADRLSDQEHVKFLIRIAKETNDPEILDRIRQIGYNNFYILAALFESHIYSTREKIADLLNSLFQFEIDHKHDQLRFLELLAREAHYQRVLIAVLEQDTDESSFASSIVARREDVDTEILEHIAKRTKKSHVLSFVFKNAHANEKIKKLIIANPDANSCVLEAIASDASELDVLFSVVMHQNCNEKLYRALLEKSVPQEICSILAMRSKSEETLLQIAEHSSCDDQARILIAGNDSASWSLFQKLIRGAEEEETIHAIKDCLLNSWIFLDIPYAETVRLFLEYCENDEDRTVLLAQTGWTESSIEMVRLRMKDLEKGEIAAISTEMEPTTILKTESQFQVGLFGAKLANGSLSQNHEKQEQASNPIHDHK